MSLHSVRATSEEAARPLLGDALIGNPVAVRTHATTIRCGAESVWPWLAQIGAGRAGWYSYDMIDNGGVPSAERIEPALQHVEVGDVFPFVSGSPDGFVVFACAPGRSLLLVALGANGAPVVTWAFVLEPVRGGCTRLLVRVRASKAYQFHGLPSWLLKRIVPPGHFVMERRQLLGIARRAEHETRSAARTVHRALRTSGAILGLVALGYSGLVAAAWQGYGRPPRAAAEHEADGVLDRFMPAYEIVERHKVGVRASADVTLAAAREQDLQRSAIVRAIFRARELAVGAGHRPRPETPLLSELLTLGWGVLEDLPGKEVVIGAVTRPWEAEVVFHALPADQFASVAEPGFVKIVVSLRADPLADGTSVFRTETPAVATDAEARAKFRRYWSLVSPGRVADPLNVAPAVEGRRGTPGPREHVGPDTIRSGHGRKGMTGVARAVRVLLHRWVTPKGAAS